MYRIRFCCDTCTQNLLHIQITVFCCSRSDTDRLIGKLCMKCLPVCFGIHCNSFNSHLSASTDDADGNLSSVCNQYFFYHLYSPTINVSCALATTFPFTDATASPTPTGPFRLMIFVSSFSLSPGNTIPLNLQFCTPPKNAIFP